MISNKDVPNNNAALIDQIRIQNLLNFFTKVIVPYH